MRSTNGVGTFEASLGKSLEMAQYSTSASAVHTFLIKVGGTIDMAMQELNQRHLVDRTSYQRLQIVAHRQGLTNNDGPGSPLEPLCLRPLYRDH